MNSNESAEFTTVLIKDNEITEGIDVPFNPHCKESVGAGRSLLQRWFGKIETTSLRSGTFTLGTFAIGLGILSFPKAMSYFGWIGGTIAILIFGLSSLISYNLVADIIGEWPNHKLFSEMIEYWLKERWSKLTAILFKIDYFITLVAYAAAMNSFFSVSLGKTLAGWIGISESIVLMIFAILTTICLYLGTLLRKAGMLGYFGISSLIMVVFLTSLCFFQVGQYAKEYSPEYLKFGPGKFFEMFSNVGTFMFGFSGISCFHEVYTTIYKPTLRRMKKISLRVSLFQIIFYTGFTLAAYFSLGTRLEVPEIKTWVEKPTLSTDPNNLMMKVVMGVYVLVLITNYLVNSIPMKTQLLTDFKCQDTSKNHHILSALICFSSSLLAVFFPNVNNWINIVGSVSSTGIVVVLPAICYGKAFQNKNEFKTKIILVYIWAIFIVLISFLCFIATILDMAGVHPSW
jgi:amino acid permease